MYKTMKIYYDNVTGERLYDSSYGYSVTPNFDHDYETIIDLNSRVKESISLLVLSDGQYEQDFAEGRLIGVNVETGVPIFEYPNPNEPLEPIIPDVPFSVEMDALKQENILLKAQSQANSDRADFQEEILTEIILTIMP